MSENNSGAGRPGAITFMVVLIIVAGIANLVYSFTGIYASYGLLYPAAMALITVISIAALSAIWGMEKWGVYVYTVLTILKLSLDFYVDAISIWSVIFLIPVLIFWVWIKKMK